MPKRNPNTNISPDRRTGQWSLAQIEQAGPILTALDAHLHLTNDQVERLLFRVGTTSTGLPRRSRGAPYAANTALRRLFQAGLIARIPVYLPARTGVGVRPHFVNVLTPAGARVAITSLSALSPPSVSRWRRHLLPGPWQPIAHDFWIREAATSLMLAAQRQNLPFSDWIDDRQLLAQNLASAHPIELVPDGRFVFGDPGAGRAGAYLLEIDLDTVVLRSTRPGRRDWTRKVTLYAGLSTRELRQRFGGQLPVIILTATTTETRLRHLVAATRAAGGTGRFWFTTLAELVPGPLSPASLAGLSPDAAEARIAHHEMAPLGTIWRAVADDPQRSIVDRHRVENSESGKRP